MNYFKILFHFLWDVAFFVPFYCPGCPEEYSIPEDLNYDYISNYTSGEDVPGAGGFNLSNNGNPKCEIYCFFFVIMNILSNANWRFEIAF